MNTIGISKVWFVEQNEVLDAWQEQQEEEQMRDGEQPSLSHRHYFDSIDQGTASISEEFREEQTGAFFETSLQFTVRQKNDMELAKAYCNRPVVIYVKTVEGVTYQIGTKEYPVRMATSVSYDGLNTTETTISASCQSLIGIL